MPIAGVFAALIAIKFIVFQARKLLLSYLQNILTIYTHVTDLFYSFSYHQY